MAAPTTVSNLEFFFDCLEKTLTDISNETGFRTDGFLVGRGKDPRMVRQNLPEKYEEKQRAITLGSYTTTKNHQKSLGSKEVFNVQMDLMILATLTEEEDQLGKTTDRIATDIERDLRHWVNATGTIVSAANYLYTNNPGKYPCPMPHWINLQIGNFSGNTSDFFPDVRAVAQLSWEFTETKGKP